MMAEARAYASEFYDDESADLKIKEKISETIVDFCAGWRAADKHCRWIPVENKLPPENGKTQQSISVWATDGLTSGEFRYNFDTQTWTNVWGDPFDITHWMPLPPLPGKEK